MKSSHLDHIKTSHISTRKIWTNNRRNSKIFLEVFLKRCGYNQWICEKVLSQQIREKLIKYKISKYYYEVELDEGGGGQYQFEKDELLLGVQIQSCFRNIFQIAYWSSTYAYPVIK